MKSINTKRVMSIFLIPVVALIVFISLMSEDTYAVMCLKCGGGSVSSSRCYDGVTCNPCGYSGIACINGGYTAAACASEGMCSY